MPDVPEEVEVFVDPETGEKVNAALAREITDQIRASAVGLWELVTRAFVLDLWRHLDYASWDAYLAGEFSDLSLRLPREKRNEVISSMTAAGLSSRAISAATGVSRHTIAKELDEPQVARFAPPDTPSVTEPSEIARPAVNEDGFGDESEPSGSDDGPADFDQTEKPREPVQPHRTRGLDGKVYQRPEAKDPTIPPSHDRQVKDGAAKLVRAMTTLLVTEAAIDELRSDSEVRSVAIEKMTPAQRARLYEIEEA